MQKKSAAFTHTDLRLLVTLVYKITCSDSVDSTQEESYCLALATLI